MNLQRFIKSYWAALVGVAVLFWLEVRMDWTGLLYESEAQRTANILLLVVSFISVLIWSYDRRLEQRSAELLQIVLLVCEAYMVNVDVFSNRLNHWTDLFTYGWNLTWVICGVSELFLVSGLLIKALRSVLQVVFHLFACLKESVLWVEQAVRQCDKSIVPEVVFGVVVYMLVKDGLPSGLLGMGGFGVIWMVLCAFWRLFKTERKRLSVEAKNIPFREIFSVVLDGIFLIGCVVLVFWPATNDLVADMWIRVVVVAVFLIVIKKMLKQDMVRRLGEKIGIKSVDLWPIAVACVLMCVGCLEIEILIRGNQVKLEDVATMVGLLKDALEIIIDVFQGGL